MGMIKTLRFEYQFKLKRFLREGLRASSGLCVNMDFGVGLCNIQNVVTDTLKICK